MGDVSIIYMVGITMVFKKISIWHVVLLHNFEMVIYISSYKM